MKELFPPGPTALWILICLLFMAVMLERHDKHEAAATGAACMAARDAANRHGGTPAIEALFMDEEALQLAQR